MVFASSQTDRLASTSLLNNSFNSSELKLHLTVQESPHATIFQHWRQARLRNYIFIMAVSLNESIAFSI